MTLNTIFVHSLETMYFLLAFFALFQIRKHFILSSVSNQKDKIRIRQKQRQVRKQNRKVLQAAPINKIGSYTGSPVQTPKAATCYFNQIPELEVSISSDPDAEIIYEALPAQERDSAIVVEEPNAHKSEAGITLHELLTPVANVSPSTLNSTKNEAEFDCTLDELLAPEADLAIIVEESTELEHNFTVAFEEESQDTIYNGPGNKTSDNSSILDSYIDNFFSVSTTEKVTKPICRNDLIHYSDAPANDESITLFALDS